MTNATSWVKCSNIDEVLQAVSNKKLPEIYGDFDIDIQSNYTFRVRQGSPKFTLNHLTNHVIGVWGDSSPLITLLGKSKPYIKTFEESKAIIEVKSESSPRFDTFDNSRPSIRISSSNLVVIDAYDQSNPDIQNIDSLGQVIFERCGQRIIEIKPKRCLDYLLEGVI